jgi:hypothetical protein
MSYAKIGLILIGLLAFVPAAQATMFVRADQCSSCIGAIVTKRSCEEMGSSRFPHRPRRVCRFVRICTECLN